MYKYKFLQVSQLPREHMPFLQNPLNYFITKYLKHEVDGDLSIWVEKCSSCGLYNWRYKDLSMSHDQKAMVLLFPMEKCLINFYHRVTFIAPFDDSSPSVTQDKEIGHMIMS